jgi:hypothetical protein
MRGAYAGLRATDLFGRSVPVFGDLLADNGYVSTTNSNRYLAYQQYNYTVATGEIANFWSNAYTVILRCNNIINSSLAASPAVNQVKGEAYAVRALCYFYLVNYFARPYSDNPGGLGVPIVTEYNPAVYPGRNTVAEVYALIVGDLTQAYNLMTVFTNSSQMSKFAARGLQAKVYLHMGDKANAKTAALDVINNSGFTLVSAANYVAYWNNSSFRTDRVETLFEVSSDAINNQGFDALSYIYSQSGYGDILANEDLYNMYASTDVRRGVYIETTRGGLPAIVVNKYPSVSGDRSETKVLRLSEMYLIAAEASLPASEADARTYLNFLVTRRGIPAYTSTGSQLFEDIINERRKELAFEGDRLLDLNRLKRDVVRNANYPATARLIPYSNFRRVFPIPQVETDANPTIKAQQNPNYL